MAKLKEENERFRKAYAKMTAEAQNKVRGVENQRTAAEEAVIRTEAQEISANIANRTKVFNRANALLKLQNGAEIKDIIKSFKNGFFVFVDAELLSDKEWEDLNDVLWARESLQFVKYGDKMRLTEVAGMDRLKQAEGKFKRWHPGASADEYADVMHRAMQRDDTLHAQEMAMLQRSQKRK